MPRECRANAARMPRECRAEQIGTADENAPRG
jgi:hypothetical protein